MRSYVEALQGACRQGLKVVELVECHVYAVLAIDLQPFEKCGGGVQKAGVPKSNLQKWAESYFTFQGNQATGKQKKEVMTAPYAVMWNYLKRVTLKERGLHVSAAPQHRIGWSEGADLKAEERAGQWRQAVFCLDPNRLGEHEEWEDPEVREAKRIRHVKSAMYEQRQGGINSMRWMCRMMRTL